jgi:hypothetical protein
MDLTDNSEGKFLYKHVPFNQYSLQLLIDEKFWLSPPELLNDPFEGDYVIENIEAYHNEQFIRSLLTSNSNDFFSDIFLEKEIKRMVEEGSSSQYGIYSYLDKDIKKSFGTNQSVLVGQVEDFQLTFGKDSFNSVKFLKHHTVLAAFLH